MDSDSLRSEIDRNWCVVEEQFEMDKVRHFESVMALGTGYMTTRSSFDEGFEDDEQNLEYDRIPGNVSLEVIPSKKSRWGTFIQLVQAKHPFWRIGIVNLPFYLGLTVYVDGEKLDMEHSKISQYLRWLDLKTATLYRTFIWETCSGKKLELLFKRFMNPEQRFVCVQECRIKMVSGAADIKVVSYIDNDVRTNGFDKYKARSVGEVGDNVIYSDITHNLDGRVVTVSKMMNNKTADFEIKKEARRINSSSSFTLNEGEAADILKISAEIADVYFEKNQLLEKGIEILYRNLAAGINKLHSDHREYWRKNWETSDVVIEAADSEGYNSQLAIRQSIYHLFRGRSKDYRALNCAKGTTSEAYLGSVCWDMEIFFQPFYIYTQPELAKMTPLYRYHILDGARRSAAAMNYSGARYPWQTDFRGDEVCALWEYADHEIHITADIVIGIWHYYLNTQDKDYLYNHGLEIMIETARYWTTRVDKVPDKPGYQIYGVMGPDEYKPVSNNNAYTNFTAKINLELVERVVNMAKKDALDIYKRVCEKISFHEAEIKRFNEIAGGLSIPVDKERNIVWQCDDFDTMYATIDIEGLWKDKSQLFGKFTTQEKRYRSKCLKQSDAIALMGVFTGAFTKEQQAASYDYYNPFTIHDSSNSICHNQIICANIGRADAAYEAWKKSIDIDFGAKPRSADGVHFANVGGMWQEIIFGFSGLVSLLNTEVLTFNPCFPKEIKKISYKIMWKGDWVKVAVTDNELELENLSGNDISFVVKDKNCTVNSGGKVKVGYSREIENCWK
jgi:kojibiose phosphorylase